MSLHLRRVNHVLEVAVDLQTVFIVQELLGSVPRYLGLLEETGEDALLQGGRTLHQPREVVEDKEPLVVHRLQLSLALGELRHF